MKLRVPMTLLAALSALPFLVKPALAVDHSVPGMHATIQDAVDAAATGDRIVVSAGTYSGPGFRDIDFHGKSLTITSSSGNPDVTLDGGNGTVFYLHDNGETGSTLQGLVIANANVAIIAGAPDRPTLTVTTCAFSHNNNVLKGLGGISANVRVVFSNCTSTGTNGTGIRAYSVEASNCTFGEPGLATMTISADQGLRIEACTFHRVLIDTGAEAGTISSSTFDGGGVVAEPFELESAYYRTDINGCDFTDGVVRIKFEDGGIAGCTFSGHSAGVVLQGNVPIFAGSCTVDLTESTFRNCDWAVVGTNLMGGNVNRCYFLGGKYDAVKITQDSDFWGEWDSLRVQNSQFVGNNRGMELWAADNWSSITNCTFTRNGVGLAGWDGSGPLIRNCIIWDNGDDLWTMRATYSDIGNGMVSGKNNVHVDPLFTRRPSPGADGVWGSLDDDFGDLHIQPSSPCVNGGLGSVAGVDLAGQPRTYGLAVDMGAYECQAAPAPLLGSLAPQWTYKGKRVQLVANGARLEPGAQILFNGVAHSATYVSSALVWTTLTDADVADVGLFDVQVVLPGGAASNVQQFEVKEVPTPVLTAVGPAAAYVGDVKTVKVKGAGFLPGAQILFNGVLHPTTFTSGKLVSADLTEADVAVAGVYDVQVVNAGGAPSTALPFTVNNHRPTVSSFSPNPILHGGPDFTLTLTGNYFVATTTVLWNGSQRPAVLDAGTGKLQVTIYAADIAAPGVNTLSVVNPAPGGGTGSKTVRVK